MKNNFKEYFQDNLLDGDDIRDCGKAKLDAEHTYEILNECVYDLLKQQKEELLKELKLKKRSTEFKTTSDYYGNLPVNAIEAFEDGKDTGYNEALYDLNNKIDNL